MNEAGFIPSPMTNAPIKVVLQAGIAGVTSISIQRRMTDSRFATRYFVGNGIDVGGGDDPLVNYRALFPLIKTLTGYDRAQGDAQHLGNVRDESFDFLFSSHCLEHLHNPREALLNWIRVVRPYGHLIVSVPDEDLYEQGQWPSAFNADHKATFTLSKRMSWSPVSINVLDLLSSVSDLVQPISVVTIDHAHRMNAPLFDQTQTPLAEAAIEFVLRKL